MPLKKYIILITALSVAILIVVAVNHQITRHVVEKTIASQQQELAIKAADTVLIWLDNQMKILNATARSVPLHNLGRNTDTFKTLKMAMKAGHFSDVYIGRSDGLLIDGADWMPPESYDPRKRPWYRRGIATEGISFTTPYIDLTTNKFVIALVTKLLVKDKILGVLSADTVLDTLVESVMNLKVGDTGHAFVVLKDGTIIIHRNQNYVMGLKLQDIEKDLEGRDNLFGESKIGTVSYKANDMKNHVLSYSRIGSFDWFMCVTVPRDEAYSIIRKNTMIFATEMTLRALGLLALIALAVISISGLYLYLYRRKYSTAVEQHQQELTGISKDLEWNITRRKEVETYYKTLFNVANDAFVITSGGLCVECNYKAIELFGFQRVDLIGKSMFELSPACQPDGSCSEIELKKIISASLDGEQQVFRWSFIKSAGQEFPTSVSLKIFKLNDDELTLYSIRDISKLVDAEMHLIQAHKLAAVGEMLGAIAHQWRQPLNTLSTYISSLQAAHYNSKLTKSFVDKLITGANQQIQFMSKTIDDFRNFSKPSKIKGPVDALKVVINAVRLMEAQVKQANITLTVANKTGTSTLMVFGYQGEFVHVLVNILVNAKDAILQRVVEENDIHSPKVIEVIVRQDEQYAIIEIRDSGCGIAEAMMSRIFNPYVSTKGASSGSGLGLYMSKMIVEKEMNGSLTAENTGSGAQFTIKLKKLQTEVTND
jgi:PAS domain S-box-containing protein